MRHGRARSSRHGFDSTVLCLIGLAGCSESNRYVEPPPPQVTVVRPVQRAVTEYLEATGTAQPIMTVDIRARVRGFLKERLFKEGSLVQEGQLLLVIDEAPFRLALDQSKLRLAESEASLTRAQQSRAREVARAQVALDLSQLNLAQTAEARERNLRRRNAGTAEALDQAVASRKKCEAQVDASRAKLEQADADHQTTILAARRQRQPGEDGRAQRGDRVELLPDERSRERSDQPAQLSCRQSGWRRPELALGDDCQDRSDPCNDQRQ